MNKPDAFDALDGYYAALKEGPVPVELGRQPVRFRFGVLDLLTTLAPLSAGALVAVVVVFLAAQSAAGQPADIGPALKGQMKAAGIAYQDALPVPEQRRKSAATRKTWVV